MVNETLSVVNDTVAAVGVDNITSVVKEIAIDAVETVAVMVVGVYCPALIPFLTAYRGAKAASVGSKIGGAIADKYITSAITKPGFTSEIDEEARQALIEKLQNYPSSKDNAGKE